MTAFLESDRPDAPRAGDGYGDNAIIAEPARGPPRCTIASVQVMQELGVDLTDRRPQLLTRELAE